MPTPEPVLPPRPPVPAEEEGDPRIERRAFALLVLMLLLMAGSVLYLLYARGAFEKTQQLVLVADDSEGVVVGMDMTFAGFAIGRVRRIELGPDGNARIVVDIPRRDAHWLRVSSVFTLERSLVGGTRIRAYTGMLADKPLPDGAERTVLRGDASAEVPKLLSQVRDLLQNLTALTAADAALAASLDNVRAATARLNGPTGALGLAFGNDRDARRVVEALARTNALLARVDGVVAKAESQVLGPAAGVAEQGRATVVELTALLAETRASLRRVDTILQDAQAISANAREASTDLGALRTDVDASLRKLDHLVNQVQRIWPFRGEAEVKLP
jgi:phospholipid/cholesterol/gamma-HCH transport system substrate-binding protein